MVAAFHQTSSRKTSDFSILEMESNFAADLKKSQAKEQGMAVVQSTEPFIIFLIDCLSESALHFCENPSMSAAREKSMQSFIVEGRTRTAWIDAGWMLAKSGSYMKCPHCHIKYSDWRANKNPRNLHRILAPFCLFVLSSTPLGYSQIPVETLSQGLSSDRVARGRQQPYNGIAICSQSRFAELSNRIQSFNNLPHGLFPNSELLALNGFYRINGSHRIACFYCKRIAQLRQSDQQVADAEFRSIPEHFISCRYHLQMVDEDPSAVVPQSKFIIDADSTPKTSLRFRYEIVPLV